MKAVANAAYTATATAGVATTVTNANKRIDASNARIATVETRSSSTCSKVINWLFDYFITDNKLVKDSFLKHSILNC